MTVIVSGPSADMPLQNVAAALERHGTDCVFVYEEEIETTSMEYTVEAELRGTIRQAGRTLSLSDVSGIYLRPPSDTITERATEPRIRHLQTLIDMLHAWAEECPARVINRPSAMLSNSSKPYQLRLIQDAGFDVPVTLLTTSPEAVARFAARYGTLIYKSISGTRSIVSKLEPGDPRLTRLSCPTQFQEYVPGIEYRVHVVGERVFACAIESSADDYRYARRIGASLTMKQATLDDTLAERCVQLTQRLGLLFAGIDLRRTPEGRVVCFEVNTAPGFSFFDEEGKIAEAVATLLAQG